MAVTKKEVINQTVNATIKEVRKAAGRNASEIATATFSTEAGRKATTAVINTARNVAGKPSIYGGAARNVARGTLKKVGNVGGKVNPAGAAISAAVSVAPDVYKYSKGEISGQELAERSTVNVASTGGAIAGAVEGAAIGTAIAGPVGTVVGTVVGSIAGGEVVKKVAEGIINVFK